MTPLVSWPGRSFGSRRARFEIGKQAYYAQAELPELAAYEIATPIMAANAANADAQEGMGAFLEKREPIWAERS